MMMTLPARASLLALFLGALVYSQNVVSTSTGVFSLDWKTTDIQVKAGDSFAPISFRSLARSEWDKATKDSVGETLEGESSYRVLSAVGPYLSIEKYDSCACGGAHPSAMKSFEAYDMAGSTPRKLRPASLDRIFAPQAILAALKADKVVASAIKELSIPASAGLPALVAALKFQTVQAGECDYSFGENLLTNFAFYDVTANTVSVRIGLSHGNEACRGQLTQLGLLLPLPEALKAGLLAAKAKTSGFLMIDSPKLAKGKAMSFSYTKKPK